MGAAATKSLQEEHHAEVLHALLDNNSVSHINDNDLLNSIGSADLFRKRQTDIKSNSNGSSSSNSNSNDDGTADIATEVFESLSEKQQLQIKNYLDSKSNTGNSNSNSNSAGIANDDGTSGKFKRYNISSKDDLLSIDNDATSVLSYGDVDDDFLDNEMLEDVETSVNSINSFKSVNEYNGNAVSLVDSPTMHDSMHEFIDLNDVSKQLKRASPIVSNGTKAPKKVTNANKGTTSNANTGSSTDTSPSSNNHSSSSPPAASNTSDTKPNRNGQQNKKNGNGNSITIDTNTYSSSPHALSPIKEIATPQGKGSVISPNDLMQHVKTAAGNTAAGRVVNKQLNHSDAKASPPSPKSLASMPVLSGHPSDILWDLESSSESVNTLNSSIPSVDANSHNQNKHTNITSKGSNSNSLSNEKQVRRKSKSRSENGYLDYSMVIDEKNASIMGLQRQKILCYAQNAQLQREVEMLQKQLEQFDLLDEAELKHKHSISSAVATSANTATTANSKKGKGNTRSSAITTGDTASQAPLSSKVSSSSHDNSTSDGDRRSNVAIPFKYTPKLVSSHELSHDVVGDDETYEGDVDGFDIKSRYENKRTNQRGVGNSNTVANSNINKAIVKRRHHQGLGSSAHSNADSGSNNNITDENSNIVSRRREHQHKAYHSDSNVSNSETEDEANGYISNNSIADAGSSVRPRKNRIFKHPNNSNSNSNGGSNRSNKEDYDIGSRINDCASTATPAAAIYSGGLSQDEDGSVSATEEYKANRVKGRRVLGDLNKKRRNTLDSFTDEGNNTDDNSSRRIVGVSDKSALYHDSFVHVAATDTSDAAQDDKKQRRRARAKPINTDANPSIPPTSTTSNTNSNSISALEKKRIRHEASLKESEYHMNESGGGNKLWTRALDIRWCEVSLLLRKSIESEEDIQYIFAAAEAGLIFTDQLNNVAKSLSVLRGTLSRWLLPYDNNTRIDEQCSTPHSVVENMPAAIKGRISERQVHYLVAGANSVRRLVRIKIADDNDLDQARQALKTAVDFFKRLQEESVKAGMTSWQLLQLRNEKK